MRDHFTAASHLLGALLSVAGLVLLIAHAARHATAWHVVGVTIFGAALILLYAASATYHWLRVGTRARALLKRVDHAMIYVLIAGTYTPICLTVLRGGWGWSLFGTTWGLAVAGIVAKALWTMPDWLSTTFYVVMGWLAVLAFLPLKSALPATALSWLLAGGIAYTLGAVCYSVRECRPARGWFTLHDLFHVLVLAGSASHFVLMYAYVVR